MNYTGYLDLNELAAELRDLERERDADCEDCDGLGEVDQTCQTCHGAGWNGAIDNICTDCDGEGKVTATCIACDGEGTRASDHFDEYEYDKLKDLDGEVGGLERLAENESQAIADFAFEDYAQQLAEDIGAIGTDLQWPAYCIDWERAANDLKQDYMSFDWKNTTYYVRSY